MFEIIYSIIIKLYVFIIHIASIFNNKAKLWVKGRKNLLNKINEKIFKTTHNIWFHAASVGEFEQARPLIEKIKTQFPNYKIILTFFSPSGYELRKNYDKADFIYYLPADTQKNAKKFIEKINPEIVFFVKYEFWYFYLQTLRKKAIKTYLISGIFRENQIFFRRIGRKYAELLTCFEHFFVQNQESADLLSKLGYKNITTAGDTRFDRVIEIAENSGNLPEIEKFVNNDLCIIAGSTWQPDEDLLVKYINSTNIKFIIAPHEINKNHIDKLSQKINKKTILYSNISTTQQTDYQVVIINNIGMLSKIYKYGKIAYIGGGFGAGIHNIIEAAVYGMPVIFGTNYKKFQEAKDLIEIGSAFSIENYSELENIFNKLLNNPDLLKKCSDKARQYVYKNKGATKQIIDYIFDK